MGEKSRAADQWPSAGVFVFQAKEPGMYSMSSQKPQKVAELGVVSLELREGGPVMRSCPSQGGEQSRLISNSWELKT